MNAKTAEVDEGFIVSWERKLGIWNTTSSLIITSTLALGLIVGCAPFEKNSERPNLQVVEVPKINKTSTKMKSGELLKLNEKVKENWNRFTNSNHKNGATRFLSDEDFKLISSRILETEIKNLNFKEQITDSNYILIYKYFFNIDTLNLTTFTDGDATELSKKLL